MPRYAAIDIGSNSIRMLAAEVDPKLPRKTLVAERQVTRIGSSVFSTGEVSRATIELVCGVLAKMAQTYKKLDVSAVRAVATSAIRDASNQAEFIERASDAIGAPVEIISGQEEARLIYLGVQDRWPHTRERILVVDVGGGSAEIIVGEDGEMSEAFSRQLGAVRLSEVFLKDDPPTETQLRRMDDFIEQKLATVLDRIRRKQFDRVIATSASAAAVVCAINRIPRDRREEADRHRATTSQIRKLYANLVHMEVGARRKVVGIGPRRAEIIVPGVAVYLHVLQGLGLPALYYSTAGLRDGIIADLAHRGIEREAARLSREERKSVEDMARRFGVDLRHARRIASFARTLFLSLQPLHRLPLSYGRLLEAAALLRDTGHIISDTAHHKHSQYIVAHSDLPGFTDYERNLVAMLCRYHRKAMPMPKHVGYQSLTADERRAVLLLTPILRIADGLDRSRERRVEGIDCQIRNGGVVLSIYSEQDTALEQWAAEQAGEVFRQVYDKPFLVVHASRTPNATLA